MHLSMRVEERHPYLAITLTGFDKDLFGITGVSESADENIDAVQGLGDVCFARVVHNGEGDLSWSRGDGILGMFGLLGRDDL